MEDSLNLPNISRIFPPGTFLGLLASRGLSAAVFFRDIMKILGTYKIAVVLYIYIYPMDPSTFLGSVWGIMYYNLEA